MIGDRKSQQALSSGSKSLKQITGHSSVAAGVIWITGYSGAGKTTIGRKVERRLRALGATTVFLDGDDLRKIFGGHWGYAREDRVELGRIYLRLCSHLASQGTVVVLAAIAMYAELREWSRASLESLHEVYLDVPQEILFQRDARTKKVYQQIQQLPVGYDPPTSPNLKIGNYGQMTPDIAAESIVASYLKTGATSGAAQSRSEYWNRYYQSPGGNIPPTPFALHVASFLEPRSRLLEVGCGNGRDAVYFDGLGHSVTAVDVSTSAIELCKVTHAATTVNFRAAAAYDLGEEQAASFDVCYSRFVLHAMSLSEELRTLRAIAGLLCSGGLLVVECRSINDQLAREGEVISPTERIAGHYRRFIVLDDLVERMVANGFEIESANESDGLAVHGSEDPVVIRIFARLQPA